MLKAMIGSGVLGLPFAYRQGGILFSLIGTLMIGFFGTYAMLVLIRCKKELEHKRAQTYGDVGYHLYGKWMGWAVESFLVVSQTGLGVAYVLFISQTMSNVLHWSHHVYVILCILPFLIGFMMIRYLKTLAPFSLVANITLGCGIAIILYFAISSAANHPEYLNDMNITDFNIATFPIFFGISVYAIEGVALVIPIENSLRHKDHFPKVLLIAMGVGILIYMVFGVVSYIGFGQRVRSLITLNLPAGSAASIIVQVAVCIGLLFTYPIQLYPVIEILEARILKISVIDSHSEVKRNVLRVALVVFTCALAMVLPRFGLFISLLGAVGSTFLGFVFPCLFHLKLRSNSMTKGILIFDIFLICFGVLGMVSGSYVSISRMIGGAAA